MSGRRYPTALLTARQRGRIAAATALGLLSAAAVTRPFQRPVLALVLLVAVPHLVLALSSWVSGVVRLAGHLITAIVGAGVAVVVAGGQLPGDLLDGVWRGWSFAVSTDWPSPLRPELAAFASCNVSLGVALGAEIARSRRWRALCILPALMLGTLFSALAAPAGPPPPWLLSAWVLLAATVFALAEGGAPHAGMREELRGGGRAVLTIVALAVVGAVIVSAIGERDRADPRAAAVNPLVESSELNPLAQVAAERALDPPEPRFEVAGTPAQRWRTRIVDNFDGVSWGSDLSVRPVSPEQIVDHDGTVDYQTITVSGPPLRWVPLAGIPVSVDRPVGSDADRSALALDVPVPTGESIEIGYLEGPDRGDLPPDATSKRQLDQQAAPLAALAAALAGDADSLVGRLDQLERSLREDYELLPTTSTSSNVGLLEHALQRTRQGTGEQFVAGFVLMARTLGASARISIGYAVQSGTDQVTSADARAWPEVWFDDVGWVAYDPVPVEVAASVVTGQLPVGVDRANESVEAAPQPPPVTDERPPELVAGDRDRPLAATVALLVGGAVLIVLVVLVTGAATVLGAKRRRRLRRLRQGEPYQQVLGAWAEATDRLVDLGASLSPHQTNAEIVGIGAEHLDGDCIEPLRTLAGLANEAAHGARRSDPIVAAHAVRLLGRVEQVTAEGQRRTTRWRIGCSTRSLRRSTRSPAN